MNTAPFVSIVIPALNEERFIGQCLAAVARLDYPRDRYEVVVVDNGSSDRTRDIARDAGATVLEAPGVTISALRNRGARHAKGDVLAFLDADCVAAPGWLGAGIAVLRATGAGVVGARYQHPQPPHWIEETWYSQVSDLNQKGPVKWLSGGNLIVTRGCFAKVGGFDELLTTSEDVDICNRVRHAGCVIYSDPAIRVVHLGNPKTLRHFFRRELWYSKDIVRKYVESFPSLNNLKVVLLGVTYGIGLVMLPVSMIVAFRAAAFSVPAAVVGTLVAVPSLLAVKAIVKNGKYGLAGKLFTLYLVYSVARGVAVLDARNWRSRVARGG